jgi:hypothetical protein
MKSKTKNKTRKKLLPKAKPEQVAELNKASQTIDWTSVEVYYFDKESDDGLRVIFFTMCVNKYSRTIDSIAIEPEQWLGKYDHEAMSFYRAQGFLCTKL